MFYADMRLPITSSLSGLSNHLTSCLQIAMYEGNHTYPPTRSPVLRTQRYYVYSFPVLSSSHFFPIHLLYQMDPRLLCSRSCRVEITIPTEQVKTHALPPITRPTCLKEHTRARTRVHTRVLLGASPSSLLQPQPQPTMKELL